MLTTATLVVPVVPVVSVVPVVPVVSVVPVDELDISLEITDDESEELNNFSNFDKLIKVVDKDFEINEQKRLVMVTETKKLIDTIINTVHGYTKYGLHMLPYMTSKI